VKFKETENWATDLKYHLDANKDSKSKLESQLCHIREQLSSTENHIAYLLERMTTYRQRWLEDYHHTENLEHHMPYGICVPDLGQIPEDVASPELFREELTGNVLRIGSTCL
jgi:hypothetical protein